MARERGKKHARREERLFSVARAPKNSPLSACYACAGYVAFLTRPQSPLLLLLRQERRLGTSQVAFGWHKTRSDGDPGGYSLMWFLASPRDGDALFDGEMNVALLNSISCNMHGALAQWTIFNLKGSKTTQGIELFPAQRATVNSL